MDKKKYVIGTVKINQIGYHEDFKIENRYSVLSEEEEEFSDCDGRKQFKLDGATTLINTNPEASVLTSRQKDTCQDKDRRDDDRERRGGDRHQGRSPTP